eukprot:156905_1
MADDSKDEAKSTEGGKREIITINVGGAGIGIGKALLTQYCAERGISSDGKKIDERGSDGTLSIQFDESMKGQYTARSLMIDTDPYTINNIRTSYQYKSLFHSDDYLIPGKHDASSNFAIAHYTDGRHLVDTIREQLRNITDACDNCQGFIINHGISGGTGSGVTASVLKHIAAEYKKKTVAMYSTMHDETFLSHPTMVYNAILMMDHMKDKSKCDYSVILDNKSLYRIVQHQLKIKTPRFKHYNCILSKLISSITAPARYGINQCNLDTITREVVPFPQLKYLTSSMWPIIPQAKEPIIFKNDIQSLTNQCTQSHNFMVHMQDFNVEEDKNIALSFTFRGNVDQQKAADSLTWIQKQKKVAFLEKAENKKPTVQFDESIPTALPSDDMVTGDKLAALVANNVSISRLFSDRICKIYDLLYSQRAYVYHMVYEGMEEGELAEA